jgi:hypothetical protein
MRRVIKRCGKLPCTVLVAMAILLASSNAANAQFHIYNGAGVGYDHSVPGYGGLYGYPPWGFVYRAMGYGYPGLSYGYQTVGYSYPPYGYPYPPYGYPGFSSTFAGWSYSYPAAQFAYPGWGYGYSARAYALYGVSGYPASGYGYGGLYSP